MHGVTGAVGRLAAQLARRGGATVIGTVRAEPDREEAEKLGDVTVVMRGHGSGKEIREHVPQGVDRIVDVALSANADLNASIVAQGAVIAAYGSPEARPSLPFWPLLFQNVTLRLLGSDDFPQAEKVRAAQELTAAAEQGGLTIPLAAPLSLGQVAEAHRRVESGPRRGRVLVDVTA